MIEPGTIAEWHPENLHALFRRETAFRMYQRIPITGMISRVDGKAGILKCMGPHGFEEIPVLLSELKNTGVPHAE
jgi:hypothetical protein